MTSETTITISLLISICLFVFSAITFFSNRKSNSAKDVENNVKVNMKLDEICRTTSETRSDIKSVKNDVQHIQEEQIRHKLQIAELQKDVDKLKG